MPKQDWNLVLHIGAGKCGSSSLQHAFSMVPDFSGKDRTYRYCAFDAGGNLLSGQKLTTRAQTNSFGYVTCPTVPPLENLSAFRKAARRLDGMISSGHTPILSNEGWIYAAPDFANSALFSGSGLRPLVTAFVRPPLDWLNSAWWQWGAWTGATLERWLDVAWHRADWGRHLTAWSGVVGVEKVSAQILGEDVVSQFHDSLDSHPPQSTARYNTALPEGVLRFYQRNRRYRPGPHDSEIDFLLARHLTHSRDILAESVPWVIPPGLCQKISDRLTPRLDTVAPFLSSDDAERLGSDPAWCNPEFYADRELSPWEDPGHLDQADELISALIDRIIATSKNTVSKA